MPSSASNLKSVVTHTNHMGHGLATIVLALVVEAAVGCRPGGTSPNSPEVAKFTKPDDRAAPSMTVDLGQGVRMRFVRIPAEASIVGAQPPRQQPGHRLTVDRPLWVAATEVTNAQIRRRWPDFSSNDPRGGSQISYQKRIRARTPHFDLDGQPAVHVSWEEAVQFAEWLSALTGHEVRLPTEAEWEHACRGGTTTRYSWGDLPEEARLFANTRDPLTADVFGLAGAFPHDDAYRVTAPVASFRANPFGLHDMHGNVAEWTADLWQEDSASAPGDGAHSQGVGPLKRVVKGGSWECTPDGAHFFSCASSGRSWNWQHNRNFGLGFRLVIPADPQ